MAANRIYLVCAHHKSPEHALLIGERDEHAICYEPTNMKRAAQWFEKHATCGKPDDFAIAFGFPQNHDVVETPQPLESAVGVKLALVNGSKPS